MRIIKDITRSLGFKTNKQRSGFIKSLEENLAELVYSVFGGLTLLLIFAGVAILG